MTSGIPKTPDNNPGGGSAPEQRTLSELTVELGRFYNKFRPPLEGEGELPQAYNQAREKAFQEDLGRCWADPDYLRFLKEKALLLEHAGEEQKMAVLKGEVEHILFYTENSLKIVSAVSGKPGLPPELQTRAQKLQETLSLIVKDNLTGKVKAHGALLPQDGETLKNSYAESVQLGRALREEIEEIEESDIQKLRDKNEKLQQKIVKLEEKVDRLTEAVEELKKELDKERVRHGKALVNLKKIAVTVGVIGVLAGGIVGGFGPKLLKKKMSGTPSKAKATTTITMTPKTEEEGALTSSPLTEIQKEAEKIVDKIFSQEREEKAQVPKRDVKDSGKRGAPPTSTESTEAGAKQESSINDTRHAGLAKAIAWNHKGNVIGWEPTVKTIDQLKELEERGFSPKEQRRFDKEYTDELEHFGRTSVNEFAPHALDKTEQRWKNEIAELDKKIAGWRGELARLLEAEKQTEQKAREEIDRQQQPLHSSYEEINKDIEGLYRMHLVIIKGQQGTAGARLEELEKKRKETQTKLRKLAS